MATLRWKRAEEAMINEREVSEKCEDQVRVVESEEVEVVENV